MAFIISSISCRSTSSHTHICYLQGPKPPFPSSVCSRVPSRRQLIMSPSNAASQCVVSLITLTGSCFPSHQHLIRCSKFPSKSHNRSLLAQCGSQEVKIARPILDTRKLLLVLILSFKIFQSAVKLRSGLGRHGSHGPSFVRIVVGNRDTRASRDRVVYSSSLE